MVGDGGIEPPTSSLSETRSTTELIARRIMLNILSYFSQKNNFVGLKSIRPHHY